MKRLLAIALVAGSFFAISAPVYAHFPATDNTMTAVLHIDPNDDPIPGQKAYLNFIFDDSASRFKITNCTCRLNISLQGNPVYSAPLHAEGGQYPSVYGSTLTYSFPERGVYKIAVSGQPVPAGSFQAFNVSWDFRVSEYPLPPKKFSFQSFRNYFIVIIVVMAIIGLATFLMLKGIDIVSKRKNG